MNINCCSNIKWCSNKTNFREMLGDLNGMKPPVKSIIKNLFLLGSYIIQSIEAKQDMANTSSVLSPIFFEKVEFKHKSYTSDLYHWINYDAYKVEKNKNSSVIILHIKNKQNSSNNNVILYSHSNYDDLGTLFPFLIDLSSHLKV